MWNFNDLSKTKQELLELTDVLIDGSEAVRDRITRCPDPSMARIVEASVQLA